MPLKIGAYVRVSTEEQAQVVEGSLESQKHRIKGYVEYRNTHEKYWGKLVDLYIDDGYSAKDTKRPQYQRMMRDIRQGKIDLILVADLSRLSRNIADFCDLLKDLEKYKAKFLSIKEQFDSSTPAGEMMLFNMINLAQFERKQTSERVSLNFNDRAQKGLKNGGPHVLGYDPNPAHPGRPLVNEEEAVWVRKAFQIYLEKGSTRTTVEELNRLGIPRKRSARKKDRFVNEQLWTYSAIKHVLRNRAYVGEREINREFKDEDPKTLKSYQRYQVLKAAWEPIVDMKTFNSVQLLLDDAKQLHREKLDKAEQRVFLLSGVIRCGECGMALIGQSAHGKLGVHRYYNHKESGTGKPVTCSVRRYRADDVEKTILDHLANDAQDAGYLDKIGEALTSNGQVATSTLKKEIQRVEKAIKKTEDEIENVFQFQLKNSLSPGTSNIVNEKLEKLGQTKKKNEEYLAELFAKEADLLDSKEALDGIEDRIIRFKKAMPKASPALLKRLIRNLYDVLFLNQGKLEGYYLMASASASASHSFKNKKASGDHPEAFLSYSKNPITNSSPAMWQVSGRPFAYWAKWWTLAGSNR
jgi:site-specific DNA recombinase